MFPILVAMLAGSSLQEPPDAWRQALTLEESTARHRAARDVAAGGTRYEEWLLAEVGRGSPERRRALLLAAALMGSDACHAVVEEAARGGRRPDTQRAYALVLYGAFHPRAGDRPEEDWRRASTRFERACLLAGLVARPERLHGEAWQEIVDESAAPTVQALMRMARALHGEPRVSPPANAQEWAADALASLLPGGRPVPAEAFLEHAGDLPPLWRVAARRSPPRSLSMLRLTPVAGTGAGAALALHEIAPDEREEAFAFLDERLVDPRARAWLWGAAGDLRLTLPGPRGDAVDAAEVAGILRLARRDLDAARAAARARLPMARTRFREASLVRDRWPATLLLALGAEETDVELLRAHLEEAGGRERWRMLPAWKLARRELGAARGRWLHRWSQELHGGAAGFLAEQGPRWVAYLLLEGTRAAAERLPLSPSRPALGIAERDQAGDHEMYRDLGDLLLLGAYRWNLPG